MKCIRSFVLAGWLFVPFLQAQQKVEDPETVEKARLRTTDAIRRIDSKQLRLNKAATAKILEKPVPLRIQNLDRQVSQYRLTDLQGNDLTERLRPREEGLGMVVNALPTQAFIIKPKTVDRIRVAGDAPLKLPGGVVTSIPSGEKTGSEPMTPQWLRLTFLASPLPAVWNEGAGEYTTDVTFGLASSGGDESDVTLESPIAVRVSFEGLAGEAPEMLSLAGAGLQNEQSFTLRFRPTTPTPVLKVRSTISDADLELSALPRLELNASRTKVLGFGLETVELTAEKLLPYGNRAENDRSVPLAVSVEGMARVEPAQPVFSAGPALTTFRVRSAGLGTLPVRVQLGDLVATTSIQQTFPLGPVLAVLLGGALGGFARRFHKGARKDRVPRWVLEGVVVGVIAFVAGILGVGYLGLPAAIVATEAGAFLTGALCGFAGVTILDRARA